MSSSNRNQRKRKYDDTDKHQNDHHDKRKQKQEYLIPRTNKHQNNDDKRKQKQEYPIPWPRKNEYDKRTMEEKREFPLHKKRGLIVPDIPSGPYDVIFDKYFLDEYMLPKKDTFVQEMQDILGGAFQLRYTYCTMTKVTQTRLMRDLGSLGCLNLKQSCHEDFGDIRTEYDCLIRVVLEQKTLILATGNNRLRRLLRKISHAPIIFLEDGELFFEGLHEKRVVVEQD